MDDETPKKNDGINQEMYGLLVTQLHHYSTLFWQIPLALFAANAVAMEVFIDNRHIFLLFSLIDFVFAYSLWRMVNNHIAIKTALQNVESILRDGKVPALKAYIPDFKPDPKPKNEEWTAPIVMRWSVWLVSVLLFIYASFHSIHVMREWICGRCI